MSYSDWGGAEYYLPFQRLDDGKKRPPSSNVRIDFGAVSQAGKVRTENQDAYLIYRTGRFWEKINTNLENSLLERQEENAYAMAVADGIGGLPAGKEASRIALTTIVNLVLSSVKWALKMDDHETRHQEIQEGILRAIDYLNKADLAISQQAGSEKGHARMGTTLTATYSYSDDLFVFHVGDSRAYLFRNRTLTQLTRDHTVAQTLADSGVIQESQMEQHPFYHQLTRALGLHSGDVNAEIYQLTIQDGDRFLLCSDGLSDLVSSEEIIEVLSSANTSQDQCNILLDLALQKGGHDNVTILIAHYQWNQ